MKWTGITGSWRKSCPELRADVDREVALVLRSGKGIVTGGALGVDYQATSLALDYAPDGSRLQVFLPTTLQIYAAHYQKRADEGVITAMQAEALIRQLEIVDHLGSLVVNTEQSSINEATYYLRNEAVLRVSDELLAFQVNDSAGVQDAIDTAHQNGLPVTTFRYTVE